MVSREHKKTVLYEKLQLLRSITNSQALTKNSIILDASKYIGELKEKVERLNQDIALAQSSSNHNQSQKITVELVDKSLLINVFSKKNSPGLLVSLLETFEELGLVITDARVSCTDTFHLKAVIEISDHQDESIDAQAVKRALAQAIRHCNGNNDH